MAVISPKEPETDRFHTGTIDPDEVSKFAAMADDWWDPNGKFAPLHKFNPVRIAYIRDRIAERFGRDSHVSNPLTNLSILDIGCGGGLLSEPLCRLGATVTGIDAVARNISVAALHAQASDLPIDYRVTTAEDLAQNGATYDVVLAMEVVEHVASPDLFYQSIARLTAPGGVVLIATLNRTAKSFLLAIVGAEYILRWLPRGTHDWRRFVRPSELAAQLRANRLTLTQLQGVRYLPLSDRWELSRDLDVNYMAVAEPSSLS